MTDAERRDLETDIRDVQTRIRLLRRKWRGASEMPEDAALTLGHLEAELRELRLQRQVMDEDEDAPATLPPIREQIASISRATNDLTSRIPGIEDRVQQLERRTRRMEERLTEWFEADARDRRAGRLWANAYRIGLLLLVAIDVTVRAFR